MILTVLLAAALFLVLPVVQTPADSAAAPRAARPGDAEEAGAQHPVSGDSGRELQPPDSLEALMFLFAESGGVKARFHETRYLSILAEPIETDGYLYFRPPDGLARHTLHPGNASVVVKGGRVSIRDEMGQRVLDLDSSEVARTLLGNLTALLRGDLDTLRERYTVSFRLKDGASSDTAAAAAEVGWELDLDPRSESVRAIVERIRVKGHGARLESMETLETNGDRTVAVLSNVETGMDFARDGLAKIFSFEAGPIEP